MIPVDDLGTWLDDMAGKPLPGAISAAAVAAAMGAALIAKVARVMLRRRVGDDRALLEEVLHLAQAQRLELVALASADALAYQAVLDTRDLPESDPARRQAWHGATEAPVRLAEVCRALHDESSRLSGGCPPVVVDDLVIGRWLLETGVRAGLLAAESNLSPGTDGAEAVSFRLRVNALRTRGT